jgi:hypothetical protein
MIRPLYIRRLPRVRKRLTQPPEVEATKGDIEQLFSNPLQFNGE